MTTTQSRPIRLAFAAIVVAMLPAVLDQTILAAAPIAALALAIVLALREVPLASGAQGEGERERRAPSLPLDRARRLAGDVEHDPSDRPDLARHP
jgi:hypothetical protein